MLFFLSTEIHPSDTSDPFYLPTHLNMSNTNLIMITTNLIIILKQLWRNKKMAAFAWSPLRALMKKAGAEIVSRAAVDKLMDYLEEYAKELTGCALDIAKHSGRKKVTQADMKIAIGLV